MYILFLDACSYINDMHNLEVCIKLFFFIYYLKEKDYALFKQQKQLLQEEQQKTASSKEMDKAKARQQVLKDDMVQIFLSLQEASMKSAMLMRKKERLELDMAWKEIKHDKISSALILKPCKELVSEMADELHLSTIHLKEDLLHLESEIAEQAAKQERMKQQLCKKEKEVDENRQALEELKEKQDLFSSALNSHKQTLAKDVQLAENRQEELNHLLQEIHKSLQPLARKSANLAQTKEQLEKEVTEKEKLQEELMSEKVSMGDTRIFDKIKADIQASIYTSKMHLAHIEAKIEKQMAKKERLKQEADKKEEELDKNYQLVCELKQKHSVICAILEAKRKIFDCQLRQTHQMSEELEEERKVSVSWVTAMCLFPAKFPVW